eukprot:738128-Prymnesium_polylepis.1
MPRAAARALACRTSAVEMSTPTTEPSRAACAAMNESIPRPEPRSRTRSVGQMAACTCGVPTPWK